MTGTVGELARALDAEVLRWHRAAPRLGLPLLLGAMGSGCGGAAVIAQPPAFEPEGQTKCGVSKSQARPLVVEWPSSDRAALEGLAKRGIVPVRYEGCEMEILAQCRAPGSYRYTPITRKEENVTVRNIDDLYAKLPLGAIGLEAKLATAGELTVAMTIVGRYDADRTRLAKNELEGLCNRATHVVTGLTAGAFELAAGGSAELAGGAAVGEIGAGARTASSRETLNRDGDPAACARASSDDTSPPDGCGALLRVEVVPLEEGYGAPVVAGLADAPVAGGAAQAAAGGQGAGTGVQGTPGGALVRSGPGVVRAHIITSEPGLQLLGTEVSKLEPAGDGIFRSLGPSTILCMAPCDAYLDARVGQWLQVTSPDIPDSAPFQLYEYEGDVDLAVTGGNGVMLGFGAVTGTLGLLSLLSGVVTLIVGATSDSTNAGTTTLVGGVMTGGGAALFGLGIGLSYGGSTDVQILPKGSAGTLATDRP